MPNGKKESSCPPVEVDRSLLRRQTHGKKGGARARAAHAALIGGGTRGNGSTESFPSCHKGHSGGKTGGQSKPGGFSFARGKEYRKGKGEGGEEGRSLPCPGESNSLKKEGTDKWPRGLKKSHP